jgi:hypothetical protein
MCPVTRLVSFLMYFYSVETERCECEREYVYVRERRLKYITYAFAARK